MCNKCGKFWCNCGEVERLQRIQKERNDFALKSGAFILVLVSALVFISDCSTFEAISAYVFAALFFVMAYDWKRYG